MGDLVALPLPQPAGRVQAPQGAAGGRPGASPAPTRQRRIYRVSPEPLREVDEWLAPYRRQWADHLNALERHLEIMEASEGEAWA